MALDDHFDPSRVAGNIIRIPKLPVAGFWFRVIAFVVDIMVLKFLLYGLAFVAREPLLAMGNGAGALAAAIMLAYLILLDGPVGKGRTVGKMLMNLRTVNAEDGRPLTLRQAVIRALILFPPYLWVTVFLLPWYHPSPRSTTELFLLLALPQNLFIALYLGQIVHAGFNPTKQGFHDAAAGSLVLGVDHADTTWAMLREMAGPDGMARVAKVQRAGWICFAVVLLFSGYLRIQQLQAEQKGESYDLYVGARETLDRYGVELGMGQKRLPIQGESGDPNRPANERADTAEQSPRGKRPASSPATSAVDTATSVSVAAQPPKEFEIYLRHTGKDNRPLGEIRKDTEELADAMMEFLRKQQAFMMKQYRESEAARKKAAGKDDQSPAPLPPPEIPKGSRFTIQYQEYLDLILESNGYTVLEVERRF